MLKKVCEDKKLGQYWNDLTGEIMSKFIFDIVTNFENNNSQTILDKTDCDFTKKSRADFQYYNGFFNKTTSNSS